MKRNLVVGSKSAVPARSNDSYTPSHTREQYKTVHEQQQMKKYSSEDKYVQTLTEKFSGEVFENRGTKLLEYAAARNVHMQSARPLKGLEDSTDPEIKALLERSEFYKLFPKLLKRLELDGQAGMAFIKFMNLDFLVSFVDVSYRKVGNMYIEFIGTTDQMVTKGALNYSRSYRFFYDEEGLASYETVLYSPMTKQIIADTADNKIYKVDPRHNNILPVFVFTNNEDGTSIGDLASGNLETLNYLSNNLWTEWNMNKANFIHLTQASGDKSTRDVLKEITEGRGISSKGMTLSGNITPDVVPLSISQTSIIALLQLMSEEKDTALQKMFSWRDSMSTGSNKHTPEVILQNQAASDAMEYKINRFREPEFNYFFNKIVGNIIPVFKNIKIKFDLATIEEYKVKSMDPELEAKNNNNNLPNPVKTENNQNT